MPRRDVFSSLRQNETPHPDQSRVTPTFPADVPSVPKQPLDLIPIAAPKKKRSRAWDRAHQAEKVTYRGIPQRLQDTMSELAASLNVPRDELVRAFLEYCLSNRLPIFAHPKAQRMTLFPGNERSNAYRARKESSSAADWLEEVFPKSGREQPRAGKKKCPKGKRKKEHWESRATYRLPVELKVQIKSIADEHEVPVGEVVLFFLDQALRAYQTGTLRLNPAPRTSGNTLFLND